MWRACSHCYRRLLGISLGSSVKKRSTFKGVLVALSNQTILTQQSLFYVCNTSSGPVFECLLTFAEKAIAGLNCTAEQTSLIDRCATPINELTSRIDELFEVLTFGQINGKRLDFKRNEMQCLVLFWPVCKRSFTFQRLIQILICHQYFILQGGLQQFLANVKNLAPVFAQGCNMTSEFRDCLRPILQQKQCIVSSCLIRAGDGICDQPDTAQAIDDNLACVFKQVAFGYSL